MTDQRDHLTDEINRCSPALRKYIHDLAADADPAHNIRRAHVAEETTQGLAKRVEELEQELAALRRPVVQNDSVEAIRKEWEQDLRSLQEAIRAGYIEENDVTDAAVAVNTLLSALDQAQREIARLSSPPEERGEIVERHNSRLDFLRTHGYPLSSDPPRSDIDTLLGDCAAWRNAHALVTRERDEARGKAERLESGPLVPRRLRDEAIAENAKLCERIVRLEAALNLALTQRNDEMRIRKSSEQHSESLRLERDRLKAAVDFYASEGTYENDQAEYGSTWVSVPHTAPIYSDNGETARQALAAADGQQREIVAVDHEGTPVYSLPIATGDGVEGE